MLLLPVRKTYSRRFKFLTSVSLPCVYIFIYFLLFKVWRRRAASCAVPSLGNLPSAQRIPRLYCIQHSIFLMTSVDLSAPEFVARCIQETRERDREREYYLKISSMATFQCLVPSLKNACFTNLVYSGVFVWHEKETFLSFHTSRC
jgi:hypothetical protein